MQSLIRPNYPDSLAAASFDVGESLILAHARNVRGEEESAVRREIRTQLKDFPEKVQGFLVFFCFGGILAQRVQERKKERKKERMNE